MSAAGYQPLALGDFHNAGVAVFDMARYRGGGTYLEPRPALPPLGDQTFHGLPLSIGEDLNRCFIAFPDGTAHPPVTVPVARRVHTVIFAHCIYVTELWQGGPVGNEVAGYSFTYADGTTEHAPIRERFEIGHLPTLWGPYPFLAEPGVALLAEHLRTTFPDIPVHHIAQRCMYELVAPHSRHPGRRRRCVLNP